MDVAGWFHRVCSAPFYAGQLAHVETIAAREARCGELSQPLRPELRQLLAARGITELYAHQAQALELARAGRDWVVVTGTASGKSLCYHLPVLEAVIQGLESAEPAHALYLYPTKALAQDQLAGLLSLLSGEPSLAKRVLAGVYDGDTPTAQRRRIQSEAQLVLSNPDMLHGSILPYHTKWARFFGHLRYVVLDEAHTYRGIFGAHVACVLRRLERVCAHYGSRPVFLSASATIGNPSELVGTLVDREVALVDDDGSPRGRKHFVLWNPGNSGPDRLAQRSAADDAVELMRITIEGGDQALAFTRTRQAAELVQRYVVEQLEKCGSAHAKSVRAYRGGYLPNERRGIEQALFAGELRGVATTNALELGIDVGSLDVTLLVGYPGTIASTWQQAGRSGRRHGESVSVLLAGNDPIDHYLLQHPQYFFAQSPEQAVVDPENPFVLTRHLKSAAFELPLGEHDVPRFGAQTEPIAELLTDAHELNHVADHWYYAGDRNPAVGVSLRHMSDNTFSIVLKRDGKTWGDPPPQGRRSVGRPDPKHEVIANVDSISAPELVYPEAVYLHAGEPYIVRELDLVAKIAYVERQQTDYYTQAVLESSVVVTRVRSDLESAQATAARHARIGYGDADVTWQTVAFKKIKFATRENVGMGPVDIPAQTLSTTCLFFVPDERIALAMKQSALRVSEALVGLRNLAVVALPLIAMCDSRDLGALVDTRNYGRSTLILYDRYPGGLGYAQRGFNQIDRVLEICQQMVADCGCEDGCPSCVGLPNLRPAIHSDPDLTRGYPMPSKRAAIRLLELLTEPSLLAVAVER